MSRARGGRPWTPGRGTIDRTRGDELSTKQRQWPHQLLAVGALGASLTLFVAASAVFTLYGTIRTGHDLARLSQAQQLHQDADMMHDALRADVASIQQAGATNEPSREVLVHATQGHAQRLQDDLDELQGIELPPNVSAAMRTLRPDLEAYRSQALEIVRSVRDTGRVDSARESSFRARYAALETSQRVATTTLAATSKRLQDAQRRHERRVAVVLVIASVVALGGWAFLVVMLRRAGMSLFAALGREAEQRAVADLLQHSLLPGRLPDVPGLRLAARSRPVRTGAGVGGDWYDVLVLPSGDVGLVVGDVVGHDLHAATAMGQLRTAVRAFALYEPSPAAVLTQVNTVADWLDVTELTTCLYAVVNPTTRTVRWSSAGHLNPLIVQPSGEAELLPGDPGPPIGVTTRAAYHDRTWQIQPRGSLMLYTDGLVERRSRSITEGLARLESIDGLQGDPDRLCDHVLAVLLADDLPVQDDVTLLALQAA